MNLRTFCLSILLLFLFGCAGSSGQQGGATPSSDGSLRVGDDGYTYRCQLACKEWGESCVNLGRGGQRCRRNCLRFGEECHRVDHL